jgi:hypothetical protein
MSHTLGAETVVSEQDSDTPIAPPSFIPFNPMERIQTASLHWFVKSSQTNQTFDPFDEDGIADLMAREAKVREEKAREEKASGKLSCDAQATLSITKPDVPPLQTYFDPLDGIVVIPTTFRSMYGFDNEDGTPEQELVTSEAENPPNLRSDVQEALPEQSDKDDECRTPDSRALKKSKTSE